MYPTVDICLFWPWDSFCVAHWFWLPCHVYNKSWTLAILCNVFFHCLSIQFKVVFSFCCIPCWIIACQYPNIGSSKLPLYDFFAKSLACGFWLPPADNVSPKGKMGLHSDTMWHDREYVACLIREISVLWVRWLFLKPPGGNIQYPQCTTDLHGVGVVIIKARINLPPVLRWFRWWIQIEPSSCEYARCTIASFGCHFNYIFRH